MQERKRRGAATLVAAGPDVQRPSYMPPALKPAGDMLGD